MNHQFFLLLFLVINQNHVSFISNRYFDIYFPQKKEHIAKAVSDYSLSEIERIARNLHMQDVDRIRISILDEKEFNKDYGNILPEWGVGFAIPKKNLILLKFPSSFNNPPRLKFIVGHEIAHILIHRKARTSIPRWFDEGTAIYLSRELNFMDEIKLSMAVLLKKIIPLEALEENFPYSGEQAYLAYIESVSAVNYLVEQDGPYIINQILVETKKSHSFEDGFLIATKMDVNIFELEWKDYLSKRFKITLLLKPNLLFLIIATFVIILGIIKKLRRRRLNSAQEGFED
jgi:hypothetical protein